MHKKNDNFFDKIIKKNYNNELEKVLENKNFDENVKNMLLSIFYKIEIAYSDYQKVVTNVDTKEEFIKNIINNIEKNCETINLINPNSQESEILNNKSFVVDKNKKAISCYPIERKLLYSIAKISANDKIVKEKYFLLDKTLSDLINVGANINKVEPLRDFNGYSWTTVAREIESIQHNLIYQNIKILLGVQFLNNWTKNSEFIIDYIELMRDKLEEQYGNENANKFIDKLMELSILLSVKFDKTTKEEILKLKEKIDNELEIIKDNQEFIKQKTNEKLKLNEKIKIIDETINDKTLLEKEYKKRNRNLPLESKIFSMKILSKIMQQEREELVNQKEEINKLLNPKNFVSYKKDLKEKEKLVKLVDTNNLEKDINEKLLDLQKTFLNCYELKFKKEVNKADIIKELYEFRYYCMTPFDDNNKIIHIKDLQNHIDGIGKQLIQKAQELKVIQIFAKEEELNYKIAKNIFYTRNINLEEISIKLINEKDKYYVQILEDEAIENNIELEGLGKLNKKDLNIKFNKKVEFFIK